MEFEAFDSKLEAAGGEFEPSCRAVVSACCALEMVCRSLGWRSLL